MWVSALLPLHPNTLANFFSPFSLFLFLDKVPLVLLMLLLWRPSFQLGATLNRYLFRVPEKVKTFDQCFCFWPALAFAASAEYYSRNTLWPTLKKEGKKANSVLHFSSIFIFHCPPPFSFCLLHLFYSCFCFRAPGQMSVHSSWWWWWMVTPPANQNLSRRAADVVAAAVATCQKRWSTYQHQHQQQQQNNGKETPCSITHKHTPQLFQ